MFLRIMFSSFIFSPFLFTVSVAFATETNSYALSLAAREEAVLGEPCDTCMPTSAECWSYVITPSAKICLSSGNDESANRDVVGDNSATDEDIADETLDMENGESMSSLQDDLDSPEYIIPEQIDGNDIGTPVTE